MWSAPIDSLTPVLDYIDALENVDPRWRRVPVHCRTFDISSRRARTLPEPSPVLPAGAGWRTGGALIWACRRPVRPAWRADPAGGRGRRMCLAPAGPVPACRAGHAGRLYHGPRGGAFAVLTGGVGVGVVSSVVRRGRHSGGRCGSPPAGLSSRSVYRVVFSTPRSVRAVAIVGVRTTAVMLNAPDRDMPRYAGEGRRFR
jgi:hypothetical protein